MRNSLFRIYSFVTFHKKYFYSPNSFPYRIIFYLSSATSINEHHVVNSHKYRKFTFMVILSFICMYILMYAMVDTSQNIFPNCNQFYMAGLMTFPMIIVEVVLMNAMYKKRGIVLLSLQEAP